MANQHTENYQRQMQAQYDAAANFKADYWPADPFNGVFVDASYLDAADLVTLHKAAKALETQGNQVFAQDLVVQKNGVKGSYDWFTSVRVNPLWLDRRRQQVAEICELLNSFYWGTNSNFLAKRQEILETEDDQLIEMLRQVEENLDLSDRELEVME